VAIPSGEVLHIRPPKNVDLTLISMLPITTLVVHPTTAAAIRQKVRRAAICARGEYTQRLEVILPGFPPSPSPLVRPGGMRSRARTARARSRCWGPRM
jgi:hypothetical protein